MTGQTELDDALRVMDAESWAMQMDEYRLQRERGERHLRRQGRFGGIRHFDSDEPGHPLGRGMPAGRALRKDGQSHHLWWQSVIRLDPCVFCGRPGGTVDHIEPRSRRARAVGGTHSWVNLAGACQRCNGSKGSQDLLGYMLRHVQP